MLEHIAPERENHSLRPLLSLCPLFLVLTAAILFWSMGTVRNPAQTAKGRFSQTDQEAAISLLVTAEQLAQMSYTDSIMGKLSWSISDDSMKELNRVLREYGITTPEQISQFLAQAAVETSGGRWLTELGEEEYFQRCGYSVGTRGAGFFHLTFEYGQMAFSTWMIKKYIPELENIAYVNPKDHSRSEIKEAYYQMLLTAANLGVDVSRYSRIVFDAQSPGATGADYIAQFFPWESAAYYWVTAGVKESLSDTPGVENTDIASAIVGGSNWQSRREAYAAFYPVLNNQS